MKALVFGVEPEPVDAAASDNPLVRMLARTPMRLMEVDDPKFLLPDWVDHANRGSPASAVRTRSRCSWTGAKSTPTTR